LGRDIKFVAEIASRYQSPSFPENEDSQVNALASGLQLLFENLQLKMLATTLPTFL
jgi:hypothetical protein